MLKGWTMREQANQQAHHQSQHSRSPTRQVMMEDTEGPQSFHRMRTTLIIWGPRPTLVANAKVAPSHKTIYFT